MNIVEKPVDELIPYEKNPRNNAGSVKYVAESIKQYGFKQPLVIDNGGVVIVGHTRLLAAKQLGLKTVPCVIADDLSENQVRAYRIADNKVADYSIWDNQLLLEELSDLGDFYTGFDYPDVDLSVLDEDNNATVSDNQYGTTWEVVFRSEDKAKIDKIKELWDGMEDE